MPVLDYSDQQKRYKEIRHDYELVDERDFTGAYSTFTTPKERQGPQKYFLKTKRVAYDFLDITPEASNVEFRRYLSAWKEETGGVSSLTEITGSMNYLRIISMGERALPYIFTELQKGPSAWFVALRAITKNDEIGSENVGDFRKKGMAWLKWGEENGYI